MLHGESSGIVRALAAATTAPDTDDGGDPAPAQGEAVGAIGATSTAAPPPALAPTSAAATPVAPPSPRVALVGEIAAHVARLLAAGDLEGARIAHEAMGRLIAGPPERPAAVVDLDDERRKRGR